MSAKRSKAAAPPTPAVPGTVQEGIVTRFRLDGTPELGAKPPVLLPLAIPGERVQYRVLGQGAHQAVGQLEQVLSPHLGRALPPCPLLAQCQSCSWMMLTPESQQDFKHERLRLALEPFLAEAGLTLPPIVASPLREGYRRRARFVVTARGEGLLLGAYASGTHRVMDVEGCPVTSPVLLRARDALARSLAETGLSAYDENTHQGILRAVVLQTDGDSGAVLALIVVNALAEELPLEVKLPSEAPAAAWPLSSWQRWAETTLQNQPCLSGMALNVHPTPGNRLTGEQTFPLAGEQALELSLADVPLRVPMGAFSQVNLEIADRMYRRAAQWALESRAGGPPDPQGGLLDLYCGVGGLGLATAHAARKAGRPFPFLLGVETHEGAAQSARLNAERLGFSSEPPAPTRVTYAAGAMHALTPRLLAHQSVAVALVNPPRAGLGAHGQAVFQQLRPRQVIYVSCNPESLARDLQSLLQAGLRLVQVEGYDMFPHTHHLETLARLEAL